MEVKSLLAALLLFVSLLFILAMLVNIAIMIYTYGDEDEDTTDKESNNKQ